MPNWWFVRHGESMAQLGPCQGTNAEVPLSPGGFSQAQALAPELAALPVERILVSPYLRARQTAEHAARQIDLAHEIAAHLYEREVGPDWKRIHYDPEYQPLLDRWNWRPPDGESVRDATARALQCLHALDTGQNTLVFAHGRILAGVLSVLDDADITQPVKAIPNCVVHPREVDTGTWGELLRRLA